MSCTNCKDPKIKCGDVMYAPCIYWEISDEDLQAYITGGSSSEPTECVNLDSALTEIYTKIKDLEEATDFSEWESECFDIDTEDLTLKGVITALDKKVCELSDNVSELTACDILNFDISACGLDYDCFESTTCETPIGNKLKDLLQEIINRICALEAA